ncbi:hypothetical protein Rt10032_c03g1386 [Rhodotorula toruloides]|uniref:Uncharacterized protein n=1 Tax=Rhodotorula toruloides TaxID=5286 RepID=A0A511KAL2_RHOTO|nr:hypothetical protein Rt10032_c03g1386 [Rhodotorula toruloides]
MNSARVLLSIGITLPSDVTNVLDAERSPLVDEEDGSKSVAPLQDRLTDQQLSVVLNHALALVTCSACGEICQVKDSRSHVLYGHHGKETVTFQPAASSYLQLLYDAIAKAGFDPDETTTKDLDRLGKEFKVQLKSGMSLMVYWMSLSSPSHATGLVWWMRGTTYDLVRDDDVDQLRASARLTNSAKVVDYPGDRQHQRRDERRIEVDRGGRRPPRRSSLWNGHV